MGLDIYPGPFLLTMCSARIFFRPKHCVTALDLRFERGWKQAEKLYNNIFTVDRLRILVMASRTNLRVVASDQRSFAAFNWKCCHEKLKEVARLGCDFNSKMMALHDLDLHA